MSLRMKLKNMPRIAWLAVGVCVTALLVPSAAYAANALTGPSTYNGIEGSTGTKAVVANTGQQTVAEAAPTSYYLNGDVNVYPDYILGIAAPPSGDALIVQTIHVTWSGATPGTDYLELYVTTTADNCAGGSGAGTTIDYVDMATAAGTVQLPYVPGFTVPHGYVLCQDNPGADSAGVSVYGYTVPEADAPTVR